MISPHAVKFAFVLNHLKINDDFSCEIIPGHVFRRANEAEIPRIVSELHKRSIPPLELRTHYECWTHPVNQTTSAVEGMSEFQMHHLPPNEWRYFIIEVPPAGAKLNDIEYASTICDVPLDLNIRFPVGGGVQCQMYNGYSNLYLAAPPWCGNQLVSFGANEAQQIKDAFAKIEAMEKDDTGIRHSINLLHDLRRIPEEHAIHCLGLFAVIESIITHDPKAGHDSLTHQIKTKIPLLSKRFPLPIDYSCFENASGSSEDTIWSKLYEVRSRIAHGEPLQFHSDKKIKMLRSLISCDKLLGSVARTMLRFALDEPELIYDLKKV